MGGRGRGKGRGGKGGRGAANNAVKQIPTDPGSSTPTNPRPLKSPRLPSRYEITPPVRQVSVSTPNRVPDLERPPGPGVRDYPPPNILFQTNTMATEASPRPPQFSAGHGRLSPGGQARTYPGGQTRISPTGQPQTSLGGQTQISPTGQPQTSLGGQPQPSPRSSHAQNSHNDEEDDDFVHPGAPTLSEDRLARITAMHMEPGRGLYTTVLSPTLEPGTTWFGFDKTKLTRNITKILTNKFDGAYYSWSWVCTDRRERYFLEFAKTHTWAPSITAVVQGRFESICQLRLKDMVSKAKTSKEKPSWIEGTLWTEMTKYWETEEAKSKSETASASRLSDRNGLGVHKHSAGPKSFAQVEQEMMVELGRPVSYGEVFIRTHTKADGTYVDRKSESVAVKFKKTKEDRLAALGTEEYSECTSSVQKLSIEEENQIFLESTFKNARGDFYGIGNLASYLNEKRKYQTSSSSFTSLEQQLSEANRKIDDQAALAASREAEHLRIVAEQREEIKNLDVVKRYLSTDPKFVAFLASQSTNPATPETGTDDATD